MINLDAIVTSVAERAVDVSSRRGFIGKLARAAAGATVLLAGASVRAVYAGDNCPSSCGGSSFSCGTVTICRFGCGVDGCPSFNQCKVTTATRCCGGLSCCYVDAGDAGVCQDCPNCP